MVTWSLNSLAQEQIPNVKMSKATTVCLLALLGVLTISALHVRPYYDSSDFSIVRGSNGRSRLVRVMERPDYDLAYVRGANGRTRLVPIYDRPDRPDKVLITQGTGANKHYLVADADHLRSMPHILNAPIPSRTSSRSNHQVHYAGRKKRHALLMPRVPFMHPLVPHPAAALAIHANRARLFGGAFGLPLAAGLLRPQALVHPYGKRTWTSPAPAPAPAVAPAPAPAVAPAHVPAVAPAPAVAPVDHYIDVAPVINSADVYQGAITDPSIYQDTYATGDTYPGISGNQGIYQDTFATGGTYPGVSGNQGIYQDTFATGGTYPGVSGNQGIYQDTGIGNSIVYAGNYNDVAGNGILYDYPGTGNINDPSGAGYIQDPTGTGVIYQDTMGAPSAF